MNALGQLTQVNEPNPAGGSDYVTTYTYDTLGHLTGVSMPRPSGTQTRTFNYGNPPGAQLLSATNPENGTVTYTYNSDNTLATKTDAKSQQVQYSYDSYKRVTQIRRGTYSGDVHRRHLPAGGLLLRRKYGLDGFTSMQYGRSCILWRESWLRHTFTEMYSYNSRRDHVSEPAAPNPRYVGGNLNMA